MRFAWISVHRLQSLLEVDCDSCFENEAILTLFRHSQAMRGEILETPAQQR